MRKAEKRRRHQGRQGAEFIYSFKVFIEQLLLTKRQDSVALGHRIETWMVRG